MIAVLAEGATVRPAQLPGDVSDWLHEAQIGNELIARWRGLKGQPQLPIPTVADHYRFAFEEDDSEWLIVDPQSRAVLPRGARGEICLKGPTLMLGYIGKAAEDVFDGEGYYCTGDGGYVDDVGRLYWEGRLTEIIKTGGANVSPLEIDAVLSSYPGVRRAQTVGVPHPTLSEMVVSCVVPQDGAALDAGAITAFLKERLASFKVPRAVLFFADDEVEVTGNGKVKSAQLRELAAARLGAERAAAT